MANIVGLNNNNLIRSDYIYDINQGKNQSEINSSVSGSISSMNSSISFLNSDIETRTQATECAGTIDDVVSALSTTKGGRIGSALITASRNIPYGWYNYVWMPHRVGYIGSNSDNYRFGTLLLSPMTFTPTYQLYIVHWNSCVISDIKAIKADTTL